MSGLPKVTLVKTPGLGRIQRDANAVAGMVMGGVATPSLVLGNVYELKSPLDAVALELDEAYDTANSVRVYDRIVRFFHYCPGATLWIMVVAQGTTQTAIADKANDHLKELLVQANGTVRYAGIALNPLTSYAPVVTGGIDADVLTAVPKAQALAAEEYSLHRPVDITLEGYKFSGTVTAATDARTLQSGQVNICLIQDPAVAGIEIATAFPYENYAGVEDELGIQCLKAVNESIGYVGLYNLQDLGAGYYLTVALSSGLEINSYADVDLDNLNDKGYVFGRYLAGKAGVFFNGGPTCTAATEDDAYMENSHTIHKASRLVYAALVDYINSPIELNDDGTISRAVVKAIEADGVAALNPMLQAAEVSAVEVYVDPGQNFVANGEELKIDYSIVPVGVARKISGRISLVGSL